MRRTSVRRFARGALILIALGAVLTGGIGIAVTLAGGGRLLPGLIAGGLVVVLGALWILHDVLANHFRTLERLHGLALAVRDGDAPVMGAVETADAETAMLATDLRAIAAERTRARAAPDDRLSAVLASVHDAVVAVTAEGQVSLVNGAAKSLLGAERVAVGTSIYAALARESVISGLHQARAAQGPVTMRFETVDGAVLQGTIADMGRHRGAVICIPSAAAAMPVRGLEHDLSLHDRPPAALAPDDGTPLAELPLTVVDTEATGLDPAQDRIVAVGAVRMHGARLYRAAALDLLVNPGAPIPSRAIQIHGITDAVVADAPAFATQARRLMALWENTVVIGHNIGFDLALFRAESARAGLAWDEPPALDTAQLAAALAPDETELDLEKIAARYGVDVHGRHTALGDCLVAAAVWQGLLPRLAERGVVTFGAARAFAAGAKRLIARQRAAGW